MSFLGYIKRYENELFNNVIPFWEKNCEDKKYGGYFSFLNKDGSAYDSEKFMWMQWRIVYMFAILYRASEKKNENWLRIAKQGFDFLEKNGKDQEGFYYFAINRQGQPSVAPYSIYSDCFAAMGAAALYHATGDEKYRTEANHSMKNYISRMHNPKGRWEKGLSGRPARLNLGHFMILANLGHVMKECLGTNIYDADTANAVGTVMEKFWHPEFRILFENVNTDASFDLESCDGRHVNPGHGLESMWFVLQYAEKENDKKLIAKASDYISGLLDFGWDKTFGGIYYFMDVLGKPHVELQADMKLWWPHNEACIAVLYAYKLTKDDKFLEWFKRLDEWSFSNFPDRECGEWFAYLHRDGRPANMLKGGKWKTFFHLPRFLLVSLKLMKEIEEAE
ncbi:MAG: hypothetical protein A2020_05600 [Lentisphaerae bacterium GWF2_45_14]|nr:MAG: hypothetical protein A2020_05600 [Lentisphaerae bacterium GWF2_45_14]